MSKSWSLVFCLSSSHKQCVGKEDGGLGWVYIVSRTSVNRFALMSCCHIDLPESNKSVR